MTFSAETPVWRRRRLRQGRDDETGSHEHRRTPGRGARQLLQVQQWHAHAQFAELARLIGGPVLLSVVPSSGLYIGGEETAVIAGVEGGFPFPRRKPPFPAQHGVHGAPTVVNNTETLAHVPGILRQGAQWYRDLGIRARP